MLITLLNEAVLACRVQGILGFMESSDYQSALIVLNDTFDMFNDDFIVKDIDPNVENSVARDLSYALINLALKKYPNTMYYLLSAEIALALPRTI